MLAHAARAEAMESDWKMAALAKETVTSHGLGSKPQQTYGLSLLFPTIEALKSLFNLFFVLPSLKI